MSGRPPATPPRVPGAPPRNPPSPPRLGFAFSSGTGCCGGLFPPCFGVSPRISCVRAWKYSSIERTWGGEHGGWGLSRCCPARGGGHTGVPHPCACPLPFLWTKCGGCGAAEGIWDHTHTPLPPNTPSRPHVPPPPGVPPVPGPPPCHFEAGLLPCTPSLCQHRDCMSQPLTDRWTDGPILYPPPAPYLYPRSVLGVTCRCGSAPSRDVCTPLPAPPPCA